MTKEKQLQITKEKLIDATISLMNESADPLLVTSREIAKKADCKASMINYCFGSRDNLLYCVFYKQYAEYLKSSRVEDIIKSDIPPKDVLKKLHFIVAEFLVKNFKFTKAITGFVLFQRDLGQESFSYPYVVKHYNGTKSDEECKIIAYELSTMMQLIIYRRESIKNDFGIDLENEQELKRLVDMRIDLLMGEAR